MSASPPASSECGPSVESIERRIAFYDANDEDWEDEEEDDDDIDFQPATEGTEAESLPEDEHDAQEDLSGVEIEFEVTEGEQEDTGASEGNGDGEATETEANQPETGARQPIYITRDQIMQLLGHAGLRRIFANHGFGGLRRGRDDDGDESDDEPTPRYGTRRKRGRGRAAYEKVPSDVGRELMASGTFGTNERPEDTFRRKKRLAYRLMLRELALGSPGRQKALNRLASQTLIPSSNADMIIHYNARCYSGQFSNDGNFFFSCAQDFKVRMYDTSNPYKWKYYKTVNHTYGQWTITDATLSPDNRYLASSSIRAVVCLASTDPGEDTEPYVLDFSQTGPGSRVGRRGWGVYNHFGIWSIRFSGDGREIVAGTGDNSVYVYDIERRQSILRIPGHEEDVNAVCFGDANSPHILYSGSDDTTLKVWDRRSMGDGRAAGVFLGHTEGLTYVDSKGDGRYILSNGKDQTAKLWDLRKMIPTEEADKIDVNRYTTGYDYRMNHYDEDDYRPHPHDCSLVTFRGHNVSRTLIRCHFSPPGSTDSRYVYSGSYDGSVYVWNLDATLAGKVDVLKATRNSRPRDPGLLSETYDFNGRNSSAWHTCVRDASWHPDAPIIAATSWNGWGTSLGTCSVHTWNDGLEEDEADPPMGRRVDAELRDSNEFHQEGRSIFSRRARLRRHGRFDDDDGEE